MVNEIYIVINQGIKRVFECMIFPLKNECFINDKKRSISNEKIDEILTILSTWKYEYGFSSENIIDSEEFNIEVYSENKKTNYHGKGEYPINYEELKGILRGVINE